MPRRDAPPVPRDRTILPEGDAPTRSVGAPQPLARARFRSPTAPCRPVAVGLRDPDRLRALCGKPDHAVGLRSSALVLPARSMARSIQHGTVDPIRSRGSHAFVDRRPRAGSGPPPGRVEEAASGGRRPRVRADPRAGKRAHRSEARLDAGAPRAPSDLEEVPRPTRSTDREEPASKRCPARASRSVHPLLARPAGPLLARRLGRLGGTAREAPRDRSGDASAQLPYASPLRSDAPRGGAPRIPPSLPRRSVSSHPIVPAAREPRHHDAIPPREPRTPAQGPRAVRLGAPVGLGRRSPAGPKSVWWTSCSPLSTYIVLMVVYMMAGTKVESGLVPRLERLTGEDASCCVPEYRALCREVTQARGFSQALTRARALSDRSRMTAVSLLRRRPELCACEIQAVLGVSHATVSHHMRVLSKAGIVQGRRKGKWMYYRLVSTAGGDIP